MNYNFLLRNLIVTCLIYLSTTVYAQPKISAGSSIVIWDGMVIGGYVNQGGYVNFGGPSIKWIRKPWTAGFGILPTMRIKRDKALNGALRNSTITPTAGFGFTFLYKHVVLQLPFYYAGVTKSSNGKWHPGIGVGYKL